MRAALSFALMLGGGFSELKNVAADGAMSVTDLAMSVTDLTAANVDLVGADLLGVQVDTSPGQCQMLVRDARTTSGITHHPQILRLPLDGSPPCAPLSLSNSLSMTPTALGFFPPATTIYGEVNGRLRFIAPDDSEITGADVRRVDILNANDWSQRTNTWGVSTTDNTALLVGSFWLATDADPRDPAKLLAFEYQNPNSQTLVFMPPWNGVKQAGNLYTGDLDNGNAGEWLRVLRQGDDLQRFVWIFHVPASSSIGGGNQVIQRTIASGITTDWGPIACKNGIEQCTQPVQLYDAIPDFSDPAAQNVLAICDVTVSSVTNAPTSNLIRIKPSGDCETIFRGDSLIENQFPMRLVAARVSAN